MKRLVSIFLVFLITFSLNGCGKKEEKDKNKTTIKIATFYSEKDQGSIYKEIAKEYEKQNPDIKIELITDFSDETKINETLSQKGDVDIIGLKRTQLIEFSKSGYLHDLSKVVESGDLNNRLYKISLAYGKYNGKVYGIGDMPNTIELFYNVDMFKKYGFSEPSDFSDLINLCKKFNSKKINPITIGAMDGWTLTTLFGMITAQTSGITELTSIYDSDFKSFEKVKGINQAFDLYGKLVSQGISKDSIDINYKQSVDDFIKGKAAMLPAGSWAVNLIEKSKPAGFRYDVFEMPIKFIDNPVSMVSGTGGQILCIPSNSKNKEKAEKFLQFFFSEDAQKIITQKGYFAPLMSANVGENKLKSKIKTHLEICDDNSIMIMDNMDEKMTEHTTRVLQEILEGRVKSSEAWERILKATFKK